MKDNNYRGGPVAAAFVLDNRNDNVVAVMVADLPEETLAETIRDCMKASTRAAGVRDLRVEQYIFPDLDSVPEANEQNHENFYSDILRPVVAEMGIEPYAEVHSNEVLYAMLNDLPLELGKPEKSLRLREDYVGQCKTFSEKFPDLVGKDLHGIFPSGTALELGLRRAHREETDSPKHKHGVPSVPVKPKGQGIS